jgi:hypothetical protein
MGIDALVKRIREQQAKQKGDPRFASPGPRSKRGKYNYDRRKAAAPPTLDPAKPLEGNGVAYFDIDGDPESIAVHKGEVPVQAVMRYMHKRLTEGKAQPGRHPGEIIVHFKGYSGGPSSFTTKVQVKSRK